MARMPRFDCSSETDLAKLVITELTPKFPDFRVALVVAEGRAIALHRSATLDSEIAEAEARCRERWPGVELSAIPGSRRGAGRIGRSESRRPATNPPWSG